MALVFQQFFFRNWDKKSKFNVKFKGLWRGQASSYTELSLFVLNFNATPYFQLKKKYFLFHSGKNETLSH